MIESALNYGISSAGGSVHGPIRSGITDQGHNRASLESLVRYYFNGGLAEGTSRAYASAARRYTDFCSQYRIPHFPLSEDSTCLFVVFLAKQGLSSQTVTSYLAALRFTQIALGLGTPPTSQWTRLHYTVRGIKRLHPGSSRKTRLPVTPDILMGLCRTWSAGHIESPYDARLLWAACCLGYFGFLRAGEFTVTNSSSAASIIQISDVAVDSLSSPSILRVFLKRAKSDPFGKGIEIYLGKTGLPLCPVTAVLNFMKIRRAGDGPLFMFEDGTPLSRSVFVKRVRSALTKAGFNHESYSGHSFRIGAATAAAAAGIPAHTIKMLGRWSSEAYLLYIRQPRSSLAAFSARIAGRP